MIRTENEVKTVEVTRDVICNKCGNSCKIEDYDNFVCAELKVHWGYGSMRHDGEIHEAHLCEHCWEEIVKEFKHSDLIAENQY